MEKRPERKEIAPRIHISAVELFGGHVPDGAENGASPVIGASLTSLCSNTSAAGRPCDGVGARRIHVCRTRSACESKFRETEIEQLRPA